MRGRRTHASNRVFHMVGGTEDNDLWVQQSPDMIQSVWEPTPEERQQIADGANIKPTVLGQGIPPMAIGVSDEPLGKPPTG